MNSSKLQAVPAPPSLMKALMAGFDAISNHIGLILFSIGLDLFLWFGPRLRLVKLYQAALDQATSLPEAQPTEMLENISTFVEEFNLFSILRTLPVGIPSLMVSRLPQTTPLGDPITWEIPSLSALIGIWLCLTVLGLIAGALYFATVARAALMGKTAWRQALIQWPWSSLQVILLEIFWLALFLTTVLPFSCFLSLLLLGGLGLAEFSIFIVLILGGLLTWLFFPLLFSPHGIFVNHRFMWASVKDSVRLTRMTLPVTLLLFLTIFIISEGLKLLWNVPADTSWLMLVGMIGHAFVTTSLLAASFVYYHDTHLWVQSKLTEMAESTA